MPKHPWYIRVTRTIVMLCATLLFLYVGYAISLFLGGSFVSDGDGTGIAIAFGGGWLLFFLGPPMIVGGLIQFIYNYFHPYAKTAPRFTNPGVQGVVQTAKWLTAISAIGLLVDLFLPLLLDWTPYVLMEMFFFGLLVGGFVWYISSIEWRFS